MKRFIFFWFPIYFIILSSCHTQSTETRIKYEAKILISPQNDSVNSLNDSVYSLIYIPVTVDGQTLKFIFDTGSNVSLIEYPKAQEKKLKFKKLKGVVNNLYTPHFNQTDTFYFAEQNLFIGDFMWRSVPMLLEDYKQSYLPTEKDADGILGMDIIRTKNWLFDLKKQIVTISEDTINEDLIDSPLALSMNIQSEDVTYAELYLNDSISVPFLFDTGNYITPLFKDNGYNYRIGQQIGIADSLRSILTPIKEIDNIMVMTHNLKINTLEMDSLCVFISDHFASKVTKQNLEDFNAIGVAFLYNFRYVLFDYTHHQIRFYGYTPHNYHDKNFMRRVLKSKVSKIKQ